MAVVRAFSKHERIDDSEQGTLRKRLIRYFNHMLTCDPILNAAFPCLSFLVRNALLSLVVQCTDQPFQQDWEL